MTPEESKAPVSLRDELADEHIVGWTVDGDTFISYPNASHIAGAVLASEPMQAIRKALQRAAATYVKESPWDDERWFLGTHLPASVVDWVMGE